MKNCQGSFKDLDRILVRNDFLKAIKKVYRATIQTELSAFEKEHFFFSGEVLIYVQALRFLTGHLNNDIYYGSLYPGHNYIRAVNQIRLLEAF